QQGLSIFGTLMAGIEILNDYVAWPGKLTVLTVCDALAEIRLARCRRRLASCAPRRKENARMSTGLNWLQGTGNDTDGGGMASAQVFAGQKLVVVGGSSGMGRQTAADVVAAGGSAVIIGQEPGSVDDTVQTLAKDGKAYGITADLTDREQVDLVREQLAGEHADATLLVNAAGFFVPKPFLEHDGADYDSYAELDRAMF